MILNIEGVKPPVLVYNFKEAMEIAPRELMGVFAAGFFATILSQEMLDDPAAIFTPEDKAALANHIGQGVIWGEEENLNTMPKEEAMAVLLHEEGHIVNGDLDGATAGILDDPAQELAADAYSAERVGGRTVRRALLRTLAIAAGRRWPDDHKKAKALFWRVVRSADFKERYNPLKG